MTALELPGARVRKLTARECREHAVEARRRAREAVSPQGAAFQAREAEDWERLARDRGRQQAAIVERCKRAGWESCNDALVDAVLARTAHLATTGAGVTPELRAFILRCEAGVSS